MSKKLVILFLVLSHVHFVFSEEIDLSLHEKSLYSEHGEDGILLKIFDYLNPSSPYLVELGAGDGIASNTHLLRLQKWNCLLLDRAFELPERNLYKVFITAENINELFNQFQVPDHFDLLAINIKYNNFYLWKALDEKYLPSVVMIRYNSSHPPTEDKVVKYRPYFAGDQSNYFGASILALYHLAKHKGYTLVYAEKSGKNLFFIRESLLKERQLDFKNRDQVDKIYQPYHSYRQDAKKRVYVKAIDLLTHENLQPHTNDEK